MGNWIIKCKTYLLIAFVCLGATLIGLSTQVYARAPSGGPALKLNWEISSYYIDERQNQKTRSHFTLTNLGRAPFQTTGWAIYFNSISGANSATDSNSAKVEHVAGTLFRIRYYGNGPLQQGHSLNLNLEHSEFLGKMEKAPLGPYLVFDNAPNIAYALNNFERISAPKQADVEGSQERVNSEVTARQTYDANEEISHIPASELAPIFPSPIDYSYGPDALHIDKMPQIIAQNGLGYEAQFANSIFTNLGMAQYGQGTIKLTLKIAQLETNLSPDAYQLKIDKNSGIEITGNSPTAIYYGLHGLKQIMANAMRHGSLTIIREMTIFDAPRFEFRGLMLDVARNFQNKEKIKTIIDLMARYKLNKLHLHLTDDEGWRLQIRQLPELTAVGAKRGHSADWGDRLPPAYGSGPNASDLHGSGYYTQADYIEILRYAAARHIEVIPEIEMPGHQRSAVKAMEARYRNLKAQNKPNPDQFLLSDLEDKSTYRSAQLYTDNVINPALPSTYAFVEVVVSEIAQMHRLAGVPLKTMHMGADELASGAWEKSPRAIEMMSGGNIANTADLWNYYYDRIEAILLRNGIKMAGWEELGVRKERIANEWKIDVNPHYVGHNFTLFVWNNLEGSEDLAYKLANAGYSIVLAPVTNLYFDMAHNRDVSEPGHNWANYTELKDVFRFNPFGMVGPDKIQLTPNARANIKGIEATMFSETMRDETRVDYMLMPRMLALAERAWAKPATWESENVPEQKNKALDQDYSRFVSQIGSQILPILDKEMPNFAYRIAAPGLKVENGQVFANHQLPGMTLRYTIGNRMPNVNSPIYSGPIATKGKINVAGFAKNGRMGRVSTAINN